MFDEEIVKHTFNPIYNKDSSILILGSFPSIKSRENGFYYGNKQNRFWKVLSSIYEQKEPISISEKKDFLLLNGIALWDVISECKIKGSSDSTIKDVIPNDLNVVFKHCSILKIFANGTTTYNLYMKLCFSKYGREIIQLPSTSAANAKKSLEELIFDWKKKLFQSN